MTEHPRWSVDVFHVLDRHHQQLILAALNDAGREVVALGADSGHYVFVIVETCSLADRVLAWQTVKDIDRHARKSYSFRPLERTALRMPELSTG